MKNNIDSFTKSNLTALFSLKTNFLFLFCIMAILSCSKEKVSPVLQNNPQENEVKYKYTIENISNEELFTFNNDVANPRENYPEVKISAGQTIIVQALSPGKITPMIRSDKQGLQTEFIHNYLTGIYQINGYMNLFEAAITGDASLVSIYFPNPISGKADSLINVKLPQSLFYKTYSYQNIDIIVSKEVVNGTISLATKIKGKSDISKSTSASQGIITSKTDLAKKMTIATIVEPISVVPSTPDPANPSSPAGPSTPTNPTTPTNPNTPTNPGSPTNPSCGMYNGKPVYTGPRGGCYYINSNGNKTYVDRNFCC